MVRICMSIRSSSMCQKPTARAAPLCSVAKVPSVAEHGLFVVGTGAVLDRARRPAALEVGRGEVRGRGRGRSRQTQARDPARPRIRCRRIRTPPMFTGDVLCPMLGSLASRGVAEDRASELKVKWSWWPAWRRCCLGAAPAQAHHNDWAAPLVGGALGGYALGTLVANSSERTEKVYKSSPAPVYYAPAPTPVYTPVPSSPRSRPSSTSSISWPPPATSPPPNTRRAATRS